MHSGGGLPQGLPQLARVVDENTVVGQWGQYDDGCGVCLARVGDARWWGGKVGGGLVELRQRVVGGEWLGIIVMFNIMFGHRY